VSTSPTEQFRGPQYLVAVRADWEAVAAAAGDFHDAVVRHVELLGEEYLDDDFKLRMTADVGARVRLLVHLQRRQLPAAELSFLGVEAFSFNRGEQADPARCLELAGGLLGFELASAAVTARSCEVRFLDAPALGESARLSD
jgi:hypothetical protein